LTNRFSTPVSDPILVTKLFNTTQFAWLWAVIRIYVGYQWLTSGWGKATGKGWVDGGAALKAYFTRVAAIPETGRPAITYDWYRSFIQFLLDTNSYTWFAKFVAYGEVLVGVCLILGILTGFAAFGGALMNFNFMLAGTASTNPVLFLFAILLILAWKTAGYLGADRYLLPLIGTPWKADPNAATLSRTGAL
jgi:thiosulfate dehydrogenase [quinone] large subunit